MKGLERIPLHDHSDRNSGGAIDGGSVVSLIGGTTTTTTSGGTLVVDDGTTSVTNVVEITAPTGGVTDLGPGNAQLNVLTSTYGEQHGYLQATAGATYAIDCSLANIFDITLTVNCTLSITNPPASGVGGIITVILRQGGTGSYTVTWPGSVDWQDTDGTTGGAAPTLWTAVGAQDVIELATLDGGTTWGGSTGGSALTVKDEGTPLATAATSLDFVGAGVVASGTGAAKTITIAGYTLTAAAIDALGFVGPLVITDTPSTPLVFADILQNESQDDLIYADL